MSNDFFLDIPTELEPYREIIGKTIKQVVEIKISPNNSINYWQSKIGGFPYLPKNVVYPQDSSGKYMFLLAQLNFSEVPTLDIFPQGILQFYLADDELYGLDFDNFITQTNFRVLYFPEPDLNIDNIVTDFDFLTQPCYAPYSNQFSLSFHQNIQPISVVDFRFKELFSKFFADEDDYYEFIEIYTNTFPAKGHRLGGYPDFTQEDPRPYYCQEGESFELLLQIDSDYREGWEISWGDAGVGNFFIQYSKLKNLDFSKIMYTWDCG